MESPSLPSSVAALQHALSALHPQLNILTTSVSAGSTENLKATYIHLDTATENLHRLIGFLHGSSSSTRQRSSQPSPARDNGELQSLLAHLFAAFALAEGEALAATHGSESALQSIGSFHTTRVSPLLREFSAAKERALVLVADATGAVGAAGVKEAQAQGRLDHNKESVAAASKHLDEVQTRLNTMAYSMEELVERKRGLEEKKLEAKERRELQRSQAAVGFLSMFMPVMAPVAAAAGVFATRALDSELRRIVSQLDQLRRTTAGLNPTLIEHALKELSAEHAMLQRELQIESEAFVSLEAEKTALEAQLAELEAVHEALDAVCAELTRVQSVVAETAAKVGDVAAKAAHAKSVCAQGIATSCRMGFDEGRRWVVSLLAGVVEVIGEGRDELEMCKEPEEMMVDEAFESGGESPLVGRKDSGEWDGPELVVVPEQEEDNEVAEVRLEETCDCAEEESDGEVPETVDLGEETEVHAIEEEENAREEAETHVAEEEEVAMVDTAESEVVLLAQTDGGMAIEPVSEEESTDVQREDEQEEASAAAAEEAENSLSQRQEVEDDHFVHNSQEPEATQGARQDEGVAEEDEEESTPTATHILQAQEASLHSHHLEHDEEEYQEHGVEEDEAAAAEGGVEEEYSDSDSDNESSSSIVPAEPGTLYVLQEESADEEDEDEDEEDQEPRYGLELERKCKDLVCVEVAPVSPPAVENIHVPALELIEAGMPGSFS